MQKEAIQHIENQAIAHDLNKRLKEDGLNVAAVPESHNLVDLEKFQETRRRFRAKVETSSLMDFTAYSARQVQGMQKLPCFVDPERMRAEIIFDMGTEELPGHCEHRAVLTLTRTAPYQALLKIDGEAKTQRQLAEWLEDYAAYLCPWTDEDTGSMTMPAAVTAIRRIVVDAKSEVDNSEKKFGATRSTLESVDITSRDTPLPIGFKFSTEPYADLSEREFILRLSVTTSNGTPACRLRLVRHEEAVEEMAQEFKTRLDTELQGNAEITLGTISA